MRQPRNIYVSTACLRTREPLSARVEYYQKHGIDQIELGAGVEVTNKCLSALQSYKAKFLLHNYFPPPKEPFVLNLASADTNVRAQSLALAHNALDLCASLKIPFYSVHAGFITDPTDFNGSSFIFPMDHAPDAAERALARFVDSIEELLIAASALDLQLLVENNVCDHGAVGKLLLQTADEFSEMFARVSAPNLGILLDTGHLNVSAHTFELDRQAEARQLLPYVKGFHIHDNDGNSDLHRPAERDSWVMNVLKHVNSSEVPIVIEAKFDSVAELKRYTDELEMVLAYGS